MLCPVVEGSGEVHATTLSKPVNEYFNTFSCAESVPHSKQLLRVSDINHLLAYSFYILIVTCPLITSCMINKSCHHQRVLLFSLGAP